MLYGVSEFGGSSGRGTSCLPGFGAGLLVPPAQRGKRHLKSRCDLIDAVVVIDEGGACYEVGVRLSEAGGGVGYDANLQ